MKKLAFTGLLLVLLQAVSAQYNNEWIDYNKTYFKIKIAADGIYRLPQNVLAAANLGNTPAEDFQLWHNGQQVPIYTSVASGPLGNNGYIEFYGQKNDGKIDRSLYLTPKSHLTDKVSLFTDTAIYFLTTNSANPNQNRRFNALTNNLSGNLPTPSPNVWAVARHDYTHRATNKPYVNGGFYRNYVEFVYSSAYDSCGEMLSSDDIFNNQGGAQDYANYQAKFNNLRPYTGGGLTAQLRISIASVSTVAPTRQVGITLNASTISSRSFRNLEARVDTITGLNPTLLANSLTTLGVANLSSNNFDRVVAGFAEIDYPRLPDAGGQKTFRFYLPASGAESYLEIANLAHGGIAPVLYNLTTGDRMEGDITPGGLVRLRIPAIEQYQEFLLVSQTDGGFVNISSLSTRNFINYGTAALQGDYLMITNQRLLGGGANNPVEQYRQYRSSAAGGGYNAKIYDIEQLVDQFAFGVKMHPLSVKNFLRFARQNFSTQPKFCFLVGKGVNYADFRTMESQPNADALQLVPTFGNPASDNLLASDNLNTFPATPIGRLNVVAASEVADYLDKVKEYETTQAGTTQTQADKLWQKGVIHVVGANDRSVESLISPLMNNYKNIIQDTMFGGKVTTFNKFSSSTATTIESEQLNSLFKNGFSMLTYFGHSSATKLDYDLDDPDKYNNPGKYPSFLLLGCNAGNFFDFDAPRLQNKSTISEKYVLAKQRGAISMVAGTHYGLVNGLGVYADGFYQSVARKSYGNSIGVNIQDAVQYMNNRIGANSFEARIHTEQQTLHGDPAIRINSFAKPDYSIEAPNVVINPSFISIAETSFKVKIYHYNLGKAIKDSMTVLVKRQYPVSELNPAGLTDTVYFKKIRATLFTDSLELDLPVFPERDKGTNKIIVSLETENRIDELSETNNTVSTDVEIFENDLRPVYPYNYAIVNKQGIKLLASTSNPFSVSQAYRMEIDTTAFFNSGAKLFKDVTAPGGIVEFDPGIVFQDSTVYYWRLAVLPANGIPQRWNSASFVYLNGNETGFNQSHLYQHTKSTGDRVYIDSASRKWEFSLRPNNLYVLNSIYPTSGVEDGDFSVSVGGQFISTSACTGHSIIFNVFDPLTFRPMKNYPGGLYGSGMNNCRGAGGLDQQYNFEWDDRSQANRKLMMDFMDNHIPNGSYVVVRKILDEPYDKESFASIMKADEAAFGAGNSLYHRLVSAGFAALDEYDKPKTFIFIYKKNDTAFEPIWKFSEGLYDQIRLGADCPTSDTVGYISSPWFGPAKTWKQALWRGNTPDGKAGDFATVELYGGNGAGVEQLLYTLNPSQQDFDISQVNATTYPYMRMRMRNADSLNGSAYNLRWWRLYYNPVPEGALAGNLVLQAKDTLETGEPLTFRIAFKNISDAAFADSISLYAYVRDRSNNITPIPIPYRTKPLLVGDTAIVSFTIDTKNFPGINTLYLAVNSPDNANYQNEQFFFNNFLYKTFYVREDKYNPLLDVTFDGIHILNHDIVSATPHIQIKLKDENPFMALNDTAGLKISLRFPDNSVRTYQWGSDTLTLTPPTDPATDNTATIDFRPTLLQDSENSDYQLTVSGKDRNDNKAGYLDYKVDFKVFNKPMISNLLNFPNPFSTSTAFVFTLTGSEVPQEFKIQILTITGKVVREITKQELGDIHIGTNITEFKWDGTDTYGSKLANGVYLYRVVSSLDGKKMDKFRLNSGYNQGNADETDKFFNKGYGKMVILR